MEKSDVWFSTSGIIDLICAGIELQVNKTTRNHNTGKQILFFQLIICLYLAQAIFIYLYNVRSLTPSEQFFFYYY